MKFNPAALLPADWRTDVVRERQGGKDARGNPAPAARETITGCLVAPRGTMDPVDRSDVVDSNAVLYRNDPDPVFRNGDVVVVPAGRMAGRWLVDGRPGEWPGGLEVGLVRA